MIYEFVVSTVHMTAGREGMKFFPFIFSLFLFVLFSNLPGSRSLRLHGDEPDRRHLRLRRRRHRHGDRLRLLSQRRAFPQSLRPLGRAEILLPFVVMIEIISFMSRPISLSVRLFANMLAGHITLKVLGGFVVSLLGAGVFALVAPLPLAGVVALTAFELLVAVLQAYVFAILTCVYLNDAIHPGH